MSPENLMVGIDGISEMFPFLGDTTLMVQENQKNNHRFGWCLKPVVHNGISTTNLRLPQLVSLAGVQNHQQYTPEN